jgi:hypothetical protein
VEAVISELVSVLLFPVQRENTAKFADLGVEIAGAPRFSGGKSIVCDHNSLAAKAGKICGRIGNFEAYNSERIARQLGPMPSTEREQHTAMTTFQVRCYIKGMPEKGLQKVEAATALDAAEKTYGGPLTAIHRQQVHCRALVQSKRNKRTFFYAPV